jgi:ribose-phosphate pyrophosphokinase
MDCRLGVALAFRRGRDSGTLPVMVAGARDNDRRVLLFGTQSYAYLQEAMCALDGFDRGDVLIRTFPDGERYQRIVDEVVGRDVAIVGGTVSDTDTLELYDLACSIASYGARTLTILIPYFGYSTMERAVMPREVVTAKTRARLLSGLPHASDGTRVVMLDLHSEGIPHYFEGDVRPVHLYAKSIILSAARRLGGASFVLGSTDAGRAKWVESLANELGVAAGFIMKRRLSGERTEVVALSADVCGARVVIYDDMIRTGGSLVSAAAAYRSAGATSVSVVATHGVFPSGAIDKLRASGAIEAIVCTDSHPASFAASGTHGDFLRIESVAPLLVEYLRR